MIKKKDIKLVAHIILCCTILASTQSSYAFNLAPLARAASKGFDVIKKIAKVGALLWCGDWLTRSFLNHRIHRYDSTTYPAIANLRVYTDGKVTVRKSPDNTMKVTHKYGTSWRSDLPQISFSEDFDQEHNTLTVQGLLEECHTGKIQRFMQWLLDLRPKRTLHHVIEVPSTTNVEITTQNSDQYTHNREQAVHVDSIVGNICIHAVGKVLIEHAGVDSHLNVVHNQVEWDETSHGQIEIHTPDAVEVNGFKDCLRVYNDEGNPAIYGHQCIKALRHPQNHSGKVFFNGVKQPFRLPPHRTQLVQDTSNPGHRE